MSNTSEVPLDWARHNFGSIRFPHPRQLHARPAIDGVVLALDSEVNLQAHEKVVGLPAVTTVRVRVSAFGKEIGVVDDLRIYRALGSTQLSLDLHLPVSVVRDLEYRRQGQAILLQVQVDAYFNVLRETPIYRRSFDPDILEVAMDAGQPVVRTVQGEPLFARGQVTITIDALPWANMLKEAGLGENVFVEIPLPPSPPPPWDEVWMALKTARDAFNVGGATAWKAVITECRTALEKWRAFEALDLGQPGQDRKDRTWDQRADHLRLDLQYLTHDVVHGHAGECTREDAALVLATLAGLLAVRKP